MKLSCTVVIAGGSTAWREAKRTAVTEYLSLIPSSSDPRWLDDTSQVDSLEPLAHPGYDPLRDDELEVQFELVAELRAANAPKDLRSGPVVALVGVDALCLGSLVTVDDQVPLILETITVDEPSAEVADTLRSCDHEGYIYHSDWGHSCTMNVPRALVVAIQEYREAMGLDEQEDA